MLRYGGGRQGIRYRPALHYAVDLPFLVLYGQEQYPGVYLKAAVMMERIIQGHPFTDGNKRTGFLAGATLIELLVDEEISANDEEIVNICLKVESGEVSTKELAQWLNKNSRPNRGDEAAGT